MEPKYALILGHRGTGRTHAMIESLKERGFEVVTVEEAKAKGLTKEDFERPIPIKPIPIEALTELQYSSPPKSGREKRRERRKNKKR